VFRHRRERRTPHIWSHAETGALMGALGRLRRFDRHVTYTALFGLLASTGMRVGEALHLTRGDVDLDSGLVTVTWGKTRNPRLVPLHATTAAALRDYDQRKPVARQRDGAAFFTRQDGQALPYCNALYAFHHACADAGLAGVEPAPRVHDLRHTFAVNTLLGWCRQHVDLSAKMPVLSAYLGHVNPASTYWYLTAIPELMGLAADLLAENGAPLP
jgi:integrase